MAPHIWSAELRIPMAVVTNLPEWVSRPMLELTKLARLFEVREFQPRRSS